MNDKAWNKDDMRYQIIEDCKCGPEPFFVLISSYDVDKDLDRFLSALAELLKEGHLVAYRGGYLEDETVSVTLADLKSYVDTRLKRGEQLEEAPLVCQEYSFAATPKGIERLAEEDRPV